MKCTNKYSQYSDFWPNACFLNMLRDGRDVLSSQLNTGNFNKSPVEIAKAWVQTHSKFLNLIEEGALKGRFVKYEKLTAELETELKSLCDMLEIQFDERMLKHSEQNLTVFAANHLSSDRISKKIDTKSIGRWKVELSNEQLAAFNSIAKDTLKHFDYM